MRFEDFFENNRKQHNSYGKQSYHDDHNDHNNHSNHRDIYDSRHSYHKRENHFDWMNVLAKIRENKKTESACYSGCNCNYGYSHYPVNSTFAFTW